MKTALPDVTAADLCVGFFTVLCSASHGLGIDATTQPDRMQALCADFLFAAYHGTRGA
jgi:hypothetical protein